MNSVKCKWVIETGEVKKVNLLISRSIVSFKRFLLQLKIHHRTNVDFSFRNLQISKHLTDLRFISAAFRQKLQLLCTLPFLSCRNRQILVGLEVFPALSSCPSCSAHIRTGLAL